MQQMTVAHRAAPRGASFRLKADAAPLDSAHDCCRATPRMSAAKALLVMGGGLMLLGFIVGWLLAGFGSPSVGNTVLVISWMIGGPVVLCSGIVWIWNRLRAPVEPAN